MSITSHQIRQLARACGFELAGVTAASPLGDFPRFERWTEAGYAGGMSYLTDHRGALRQDPRSLLPSAQSVVCVGKLYNNLALETALEDEPAGTISRYAVGEDYHEVMRAGLESLRAKIVEAQGGPMESRVCVDTAPLLERSLARQAGLGWIGKNTCLINQQQGSWFFLGELLLSIAIAPDVPPPDRCGTCRRCIEACPTSALVPDPDGQWTLDARLCISYLTIEHRSAWPDGLAGRTGVHLFGCDICQEVCPWNRDAGFTDEPAFQARPQETSLTKLSDYSAEEFRQHFRHSPIWRSRYSGFLRNVASAMGNTGSSKMYEPLQKLAASEDAVVATTAHQALSRLLAAQDADEELLETGPACHD